MKKITTLTVIGLSAILLAACSSDSSNKKNSEASETKTEQQTTVASKAEPTAEEKDALEKAKMFSKSLHSSKERVKAALVSNERLPKELAQYAVDNLEVNWKEEALIYAQGLLPIRYYSNEELKDILVNHEKFTEEEAQYAIDNLNRQP